MSLESAAENYFSKLNPIASRMYVDMTETKLSYEGLWSRITEKEQKDILSESIIKPEILIKYKPKQENQVCNEFSTKFIFDDNCSYRDEHSGPFSFRSQSQRDLTVFKTDVEAQKTTRIVPPNQTKPKVC